MSNSANMNMEQRLAQRLKESELGMLLDEDALYEICNKAIHIAFFEKREVKDGYYHTKSLPPLLVEMAETTFTEAMKKQAEKVATKLAETPEFQKLVIEAAVTQLPKMMGDFGNHLLGQSLNSAHTVAIESIKRYAEGVLIDPVTGSPVRK